MLIFIFISLLVVNGVIAYQDFRTRSIHWLNIPALLFLLVAFRFCTADWTGWTDILFNVGFVLFQMGGIALYFSIKTKRWVNPIDSLIGLGDILYLLVLTTTFSTINFIAFLVIALIISLVTYVTYRVFFTPRLQGIPLAALVSICFVGVTSYSLITGLPLVNDDALLMHFYE